MKHLLAVLAGSCLMACTTTPDTPTVPPADKDTCGAAKYASLIGKPITDPGAPPAGPHVRHIRPNSAVTMDFSETRLNIDIDAKDVITGFRCF